MEFFSTPVYSFNMAIFHLVLFLGIQNMSNGQNTKVGSYYQNQQLCQYQNCQQPAGYINPCCYYRQPVPAPPTYAPVIPYIPPTTTTTTTTPPPPPPTYAPAVPYIPTRMPCQPYPCQQPLPYINPCCYYTSPVPITIPTTTIPTTTTTPAPPPPPPPPTIPPITTVPCYYHCGYCPPVQSPTTTTPVVVVPETPTCPYGRRRRSVQRSCGLNSQCPNGSMCCQDSCSGGKVCKREFSRNATITGPKMHNPGVTVNVVMTSASLYSAWFIKSQLLPVYLSLGSFFHVELIPYGLIHQNGACQYGQGDCYGNWVISCSAKYFMNQLSMLKFTSCLMQYSWVLQGDRFEDILSFSKMCVEQQERGSLVWPEVLECTKKAEGYQLFLAAGHRQKEIGPNIYGIPVVAINNRLIITHPSQLHYFPNVLCQMLGNIPEANATCKRILGY